MLNCSDPSRRLDAKSRSLRLPAFGVGLSAFDEVFFSAGLEGRRLARLGARGLARLAASGQGFLDLPGARAEFTQVLAGVVSDLGMAG